jgi:hypothetical protein
MRKGMRRSLLLDSSRNRRISKKKRVRNNFLNFFAGFVFLKKIKTVFKFSFIAGFILTCMTLFLVFAIFSPYYELKNISVVSDSTNIPSEVVQNILNPFLNKNLFFIQKKAIQHSLQTKFPEINSLSITEKWPSEIEIDINVDPVKYNIFDEESANFSSITNNGIIIKNNSTEGLPIIKIIQYNKPLTIHQNIIPSDWLRKIDIAEDFLKHEIKLPVREIKLLMKAREVHIITTADAAIWIDLSQSIEQQLRKLILSEGKIKLYSKKFHHIDLRIPKQIFWEWK